MSITVVQPLAPRYTVATVADKLLITLPARRRIFDVLFYGVFAIAFLFMLLPVVAIFPLGALELLRQRPDALGAISFMLIVGLILIGCGSCLFLSVLYAFLWALAGREDIEISSSFIRVSHRIPGWKRSKEYSAQYIQGLRVSPRFVSSGYSLLRLWPWFNADLGQAAFDYGAKTIRFAETDEAEAKMMLAEIRHRFPQYA